MILVLYTKEIIVLKQEQVQVSNIHANLDISVTLSKHFHIQVQKHAQVHQQPKVLQKKHVIQHLQLEDLLNMNALEMEQVQSLCIGLSLFLL